MSETLYFVGLDVGGTSMKCGIVDDAGNSHSLVNLPTEPERGQEAGLATMAEAIRQAVAAAHLTLADIAAIGVATPGLGDIPTGTIVDPPNLKPWKNVPVKQYIMDTFHLPTTYQNDANAAAYGEFWMGAAKGVDSMVLFTLGTGVGGGVIVNGRIVEGRHSHGGELGHMKIVVRDGRWCGCGRRGCLEAYASATGVVKRAREALSAGAPSSRLRCMVTNLDHLSAREVFEAASAGDELAASIVEETAFYLAIGAVNVMHTVDPDMVVFAGGMVAAGEPFLARIRHHVMENACAIPAAKTEVRFATLGGDAGYIGSAGCARQAYHDQRRR